MSFLLVSGYPWDKFCFFVSPSEQGLGSLTAADWFIFLLCGRGGAASSGFPTFAKCHLLLPVLIRGLLSCLSLVPILVEGTGGGPLALWLISSVTG